MDPILCRVARPFQYDDLPLGTRVIVLSVSQIEFGGELITYALVINVNTKECLQCAWSSLDFIAPASLDELARHVPGTIPLPDPIQSAIRMAGYHAAQLDALLDKTAAEVSKLLGLDEQEMSMFQDCLADYGKRFKEDTTT